MLSYMDDTLFPDECTILEIQNKITNNVEYVYPIFKNGSSSLLASCNRSLSLKEINNLDKITIFVRDPLERFLAGVNQYIKNNNTYDKHTIINMVNRYLFFDRHFCPQFYWVVNLQRFTKANMSLKSVSQTCDYTSHNINVNHAGVDELLTYFNNNSKLHYYLELDKVLFFKLINKTVSFDDIVENIDTDVYNDIIMRTKKLCSVLD